MDGFVGELRAANLVIVTFLSYVLDSRYFISFFVDKEKNYLNKVRACESLLTMTHDLKATLLLNDTQTLMQLHENRRKALNARTQKIKSKILRLNDVISEAIWEMECVLGGGQPNGSLNKN